MFKSFVLLILIPFVCYSFEVFPHNYNKIYIDKNKLVIAKQVLSYIRNKDWKSAYSYASKDEDISKFVSIMSCALQKNANKPSKCPIYITHAMLNNSAFHYGTTNSISTKTVDHLKNTSLNDLLWAGKVVEASLYIQKHKQKITENLKMRLKLKQGKASNKELLKIQNLVNKDFALRLDYISWCIKNNRISTGLNLLLTTTTNISHPQQLWELKKLYIREIIYHRIQKFYKQAYLLSTTYHDSGINFNDAEWLSGWIALEFLNEPSVAVKHFTTLYSRVSTPISISKATYWLARAYEKLKNTSMASKMYKASSEHYHTFYGQLSLIKITGNTKKASENSYFTDLREYRAPLKQDHFTKICYITALINENNISYAFLEYIVKRAKTREELFAIYGIVKQAHNPYILVMYAKLLEKRGIILYDILYPTYYSNIVKEHQVSPALIYSIMRQESRFSQYAKSSSGALGIMQLMPKTAKHITKKIGTTHISDLHLVDSLRYNIRLGASTIKESLDYYGNSLIPAIAAYNAGITNVNKWMNTLHDVRKLKTVEERINWIESIPFYETRDYVIRVLEGLSNYKKLATKKEVNSIIDDIMS